MSLGTGKDTFSFKQNNFNHELDNYWRVGDKVVISYKTNTTSTDSSDVIMNGIVTAIPLQEASNNNVVSVNGNNYTESLMNALVFYAPSSATSLHTYMQEALNSINLFSANFKVLWSSTNPSTKSDGSAFPTYSERWYYKNYLSLLEKYSMNKYTEDGDYFWYVDVDNNLVWQPKTNNVSGSFSTSDAFQSMSIKKDTSGIINFVICKGGLSPRGNPITVRVDDPISRVKNGFKYYLLIDENNTSKNLYGQDQLAGAGGSWDKALPISSANYPTTTGWNATINVTADGDVPAMTAGSPVVCASFKQYDNAVRQEVRAMLQDAGQNLINTYKNGKLSIDLTFAPGKGWSLGQVINVTIPGIGFVSKPLRVKSVEITDDNERYTLEEDVGTI
jgi:hypothetical protein